MNETLSSISFGFLCILTLLFSGCQSPKEDTEVKKSAKIEDSIPKKEKVEQIEVDKDSIPKEDLKLPKITHRKAIGYWKINAKQNKFENGTVALFTWPQLFWYDGRYVTLYFIIFDNVTRWPPLKWKSKDSYYKLQPIWKGDSLFYKTPFHRIEFLGLYRDSVMLKTEEFDSIPHTWIYERVTWNDIKKDHKILVKKRAPFDYELSKEFAR